MKLVFNKNSISLVTIFFAISIFCKLGFPTTPQLAKQRMSGLLGGVRESAGSQNSAEIESLAKFAVDEHNKKENTLLEFARVVKAKEQVVSGTMHHLTLEAIDAGQKKIYEAKVWVKPWENFKQLQEFQHADGNEPGWRTVPTHDPAVKEAANHAVKTLQQMSNSLAPYELLEIVHAKSKETDDVTEFDVLLKLKRGSQEEKFKFELHKNSKGTFHFKQMGLEQEQS